MSKKKTARLTAPRAPDEHYHPACLCGEDCALLFIVQLWNDAADRHEQRVRAHLARDLFASATERSEASS